MAPVGRDSEPSVDPEQALGLLRSLPLLQNVTEINLKKISEAVKPVQFRSGESIVKLGGEGAGLYIIWKGEAKVISPPSDYPVGHKESLLRCGDYFGTATTRRVRQKYNVDILAITEVFCLVLAHENGDLLLASSVWDWDSRSAQGPSKIERVMQLETIEADLFRTYMPVPHRTVSGNYFGGQFVAQALVAATKSVSPALYVHSLHSYFLRTGDENGVAFILSNPGVKFLEYISSVPVVYRVHRTREGGSFATRHVKALQKGQIVFVLYASFKRPEEGFEHSEPMPSAPDPDEVAPLEQRYEDYLTDPRLPLATKKKYAGVRLPLPPIEMRYVHAGDRFSPKKLEPRQSIWLRSREKLPDDQSLHRCVGAFASDFTLLETSLRPHPESVGARMQVLSLDHMIWFHGSFRADEWLLYVTESPVANDGRGLNFGKIYRQDGKLVMSVAQEGVIRKVEDKAARIAKL